MTDIFREVDEEVRRDQLLALWQRYRIPLAILFLLTVVGIGGWNLWRERENRAREAESAKFNEAVEMLSTGDSATARTALEGLEKDAGHGYRFLARLRDAASLAEAGDNQGALAIYDAIAADEGLERRQREFGDLLAAYLLVDMENSDAVRARLQPLAVDDGTWRYSAWDLLALLDFTDGDTVAAAETYRRLTTDSGTPAALRQRATDMLDLIESSGLDSGDVAATPPAEGEPAEATKEPQSSQENPDTDEEDGDQS